MAPVAISTTEHNEAALIPTKFPQRINQSLTGQTVQWHITLTRNRLRVFMTKKLSVVRTMRRGVQQRAYDRIYVAKTNHPVALPYRRDPRRIQQ